MEMTISIAKDIIPFCYRAHATTMVTFMIIYVGPAGRVHDARMLRCSPIFQQAILANSGSFLETVLTLAATFHLLLPVIF